MSNLLKQSAFSLCVSLLFFTQCSSGDEPESFDCSTSDLEIDVAKTDPVDCISKGTVTISGSLGEEPYKFALDDDNFLTSGSFTEVVAGTHVAKVKDKNGCVIEENVSLAASSSTTEIQNVTKQTSGCGTSNGSITVSAVGSGTLSYSLDNNDFSNTTGIFSNLAAGSYSVYVKDDEDCIDSNSNVKVTTGVSYEDDIFPILETNCIKSGCHNGDNGVSRDWNVFANVQAKAQGIKTKTGNKSMPKDIAPAGLPQDEIDLIACWVDDGALNN